MAVFQPTLPPSGDRGSEAQMTSQPFATHSFGIRSWKGLLEKLEMEFNDLQQALQPFQRQQASRHAMNFALTACNGSKHFTLEESQMVVGTSEKRTRHGVFGPRGVFRGRREPLVVYLKDGRSKPFLPAATAVMHYWYEIGRKIQG